MKSPAKLAAFFAALVVALRASPSAQASCANPDVAADALLRRSNERTATARLGSAWHLKVQRLVIHRQNPSGTRLLLAAEVDVTSSFCTHSVFKITSGVRVKELQALIIRNI